MENLARIIVVPLCLLSAGCSTSTSLSPLRFSPPPVTGTERPTTPTRSDAVAMVGKYLDSYEEAQRNNADARQGFEVPSMVAIIGGIASTAFGGGADGVLAAGTASTIFRSGNSYYAPQSKSAMYGSAVQALICLRRSANGALTDKFSDAVVAAGGTQTSADHRIYDEVENGVSEIKGTLTGRLSTAGSTTDVAGIAAEYEKSVRASIEAQRAGDVARNARYTASVSKRAPGVVGVMTQQFDEDIREARNAETAAAMAELQSDIKQCALRAKGS